MNKTEEARVLFSDREVRRHSGVAILGGGRNRLLEVTRYNIYQDEITTGGVRSGLPSPRELFRHFDMEVVINFIQTFKNMLHQKSFFFCNRATTFA